MGKQVELSRENSGSLISTKPVMTFARHRRLFLVLLCAPAFVYVLAVAVWPLLQGVYFSLYEYNLMRPASRAFVGLQNYRDFWADEAARGAIITTSIFTFSAVTLELILGLGLALLLWRDSVFERALLALLLIPVTVTPVAVGLIFRALLAPDFGVLGYYFAEWGLSGPRGFLGNPATALWTLVAIDAWEWTPLVTLILLAGLKSLPTDILEAAEADGATLAQRFRLIILPMLLPTIFLAAVLRSMDAFKVFDIIFATTNGGPGDATNTMMLFAVKEGLQFFNIGRASTVANLMIVCIALFSVAFVILIRGADRKANER